MLACACTYEASRHGVVYLQRRTMLRAHDTLLQRRTMLRAHNTCVSYKTADVNSAKSLDRAHALVSYAKNGLGVARSGSARTRVLAKHRSID